MYHRNSFRVAVALQLLVALLAMNSQAAAQAPANKDGLEFGQTRVWSIHLEVAQVNSMPCSLQCQGLLAAPALR